MNLNVVMKKDIALAFLRKSSKYSDLKSDLVKSGWTTTLIPLEVESRWYISNYIFKALTEITKKVHTPLKRHKELIVKLSQLLLLCSSTIFQAPC